MEREQYELAIEEQAYPFEEKAIAVHESNLKLISRGVYNAWIDKSLQKLAESVPARYDKPEDASGIISSADTYVFAIDRPIPAYSHVAKSVGSVNAPPAQAQEPGSVTESALQHLPGRRTRRYDRAGNSGAGPGRRTRIHNGSAPHRLPRSRNQDPRRSPTPRRLPRLNNPDL